MRALLLSAVLLVAPMAASGATPAACGRTCLDRLADAYMDAMVAKDPGRLPWARVNGYSEDGVRMMVGDALWGSITAHSSEAIHASDPTTGEAAWIGTVQEHGQPAFFALRLKAAAGRIQEVETIVRRKGGPAAFGDPQAWRPDPAFAAAPAAAASRKALLAAQGRLAPDCARTDNGLHVAACAPRAKVRAQRAPLVDTVRGIVLTTGFLDYPARDLSGPTRYPESQGYIAVSKVHAGQVVGVESVLTDLPYLMPPPFGR